MELKSEVSERIGIKNMLNFIWIKLHDSEGIHQKSWRAVTGVDNSPAPAAKSKVKSEIRDSQLREKYKHISPPWIGIR